MDGEWFGWGMNEWEEGISKWRAKRVKSTFKKKYGRSLGSSRKSSHFSRRHKMSARHSRSNMQRLHRVSPKMQREWAEGISQWVIRREVARSNHYFLKKFGIIKGNSSEEWKEGMQKWMDQNLLNKSWKWRASKGRFKPSKNRRRIKRLKRIANDTKKLRDDFLLSEINTQKQSHALSADKEILPEEFQIYLFKNEKQFGPYSLENIENFLTNDQLKLDDLAYYKGCGNWIKVQQIPGLNFKENIETKESLTIVSEQSKEVVEVDSLKEDKIEYLKKEDESSDGLELLEKQINAQKNSKIFTLKFYSWVGFIVCLVFGIGYYHGTKSYKTAIVNKHPDNESKSLDEINYLLDEKIENVQYDEAAKAIPENREYKKNSNVPFGSLFSVLEAGGLEMLWVKPGKFTMGKMGGYDSDGVGSQQKVSITNGFYLGKYEVTQLQYEDVMQGNDFGLESNPSWSKGENEPVTRISWNDIQIFLEILNFKERKAGRLPSQWNYSLPTEAEWEYACRAGTTTNFYWGDEMNASLANCDGTIGGQIRVGQYPSNAWGFYDMHGNVGERVFDWYSNYSEQHEIDPSGPPKGEQRIIRGGNYGTSSASSASHARTTIVADFVTATGFRVVLRPYSLSSKKFTIDLNSSVSIEMRWAQPGTFFIGSPTTETGSEISEDERIVHLTSGFYLGEYEVTQAQYEAVMSNNNENLRSTPSYWQNNPNRPVDGVSWDDVQIYLTRLNDQQSATIPVGWECVLPTEAQWEYACRAGTATAYSWGATITSSNANYNWDGGGTTGNDFKQTREVGQYSANPWGFFDMHGNVSEWTLDWYQASYPVEVLSDPVGPLSGSGRVIRGGSWRDAIGHLRSAKRKSYSPTTRNSSLGFRVCFQKQN